MDKLFVYGNYNIFRMLLHSYIDKIKPKLMPQKFLNKLKDVFLTKHVFSLFIGAVMHPNYDIFSKVSSSSPFLSSRVSVSSFIVYFSTLPSKSK